MPTLSANLRRDLERTIIAAREIAESAARAVLTQLAVDRPKADKHMSEGDRRLRNHLRARARQLGDHQKENDELQIDHLTQECAYEHWHQMLCARFLAENHLLIEPENQVAISLDECRELATEAKTYLWPLAGKYAERMLPQIFRPDDPLLAFYLPREHALKLEQLLDSLTRDIFTATDSLGWVYQFWQTKRKDEVNASEVKIGADELPAVTQLFTEDYMVDFLLDNTLGAWWAGKVLAVDPSIAAKAKNEDEMRDAVSLPGLRFNYLRFRKTDDSKWTPAAGVFEGWPRTAKDLKVIDPCCGSGHFLVALLDRLTAIRMKEEHLPIENAVRAVIAENLHGLEIDPRCTQIAAFAVALAAWKAAPHSVAEPLPVMNIACSGLAPNAKRNDWLKLAGENDRLQRGMARLFMMFNDAPVLGSLINPRQSAEDMFIADYHELQPLLEKALMQEAKDVIAHEMAVTARGMSMAAEILAGQFSLVATNVPYLGQKKQAETLKNYCLHHHPTAKADLSTCFVERCLSFCSASGTIALVTPQNWLFLGTYQSLRENILYTTSWNMIARLGPKGFQTPMWDFNIVLLVLSRTSPEQGQYFHGLDVADEQTPDAKARTASTKLLSVVDQKAQLNNPDARIGLENNTSQKMLSEFAISMRGIVAGDGDKWCRQYWELQDLSHRWKPLQSSVGNVIYYGGREQAIDWSTEGAGMLRPGTENQAYGKVGIAIRHLGDLPATLYDGALYDQSTAVIIPNNIAHLPALWTFCISQVYVDYVRSFDQALKVTNATLLKVPFDLEHWQKIAAEKYPDGLPKPYSSDPTQWLFNGHPVDSDNVLHVAVARMLGYRWPRQTGSSFPDCPALGPDGLEEFADDDGIVGIPPIRGEDSAADRLRALLAKAYGKKWKPSMEAELIAATGSSAHDLDEWLRNDFFEQHCILFHHRPFIWHIWDGRKRDGFHILVHYHRLAEDGGKGKLLLEKLAHSYLNDWISRQKDGLKHGEGGSDARLEAAQTLQETLIAISEGAPPYDIFVRWKPLSQQPTGWDPDINDGVRLNIRPFVTAGVLRSKKLNVKWTKDRGKEPNRPKDQFPWFWGWDEKTADFPGHKTFDGNRWNDCHYTLKLKQAARAALKGDRK